MASELETTKAQLAASALRCKEVEAAAGQLAMAVEAEGRKAEAAVADASEQAALTAASCIRDLRNK